MRRARSQLNRLSNQGMAQGGVAPLMNSEAMEIQRRLDVLNGGNVMMHNPMMMQPQMAHQSVMHPQMAYQPAIQPHIDPAQMSAYGYPQANPYSHYPQPAYQAAQNMPFQQMGHPQDLFYETPAPAPVASHAPSPAPVPTPAPVNQQSPQLDNIKRSLEQMSSKLQSMNQANAAESSNQANSMQQIDMLKQHYNHINSELEGIKAAISGISFPDNTAANMDILHETLNANYRAIMEQIDKSATHQIDSSVFTNALHASQHELGSQIEEIKSALRALNEKPNNADIYAKTLEVSHDDLSKRLDDLHISLQANMPRPEQYLETVENSNRELQQQIRELQDAFASGQNAAPVTPEVDFSSVEMRLEEITRAVVALSLNDGNVNNLERIEARISDVAKTLDAMGNEPAPAGGFELDLSAIDALDQKLNDISSLLEKNSSDTSEFEKLDAKLGDIASLMQAATPDLDVITRQINTLSEKFENFSAVSVPSNVTSSEASEYQGALLQRMDLLVDQISENQHQQTAPSDNTEVLQYLEQIAGAIDQLSATPSTQSMETDASQLSSIESQLAEITKQLSSAPSAPAFSDETFAPITSRLTGIEEQLSASRDVAIEVASKAAEDAVKMTMQSSSHFAAPSNMQPDNTALDSMRKMLEQISQQSETHSAQGIEALGAVSETLNRMVERIGNIESGMAEQKGQFAQLATQPAPPLMAQPAAMPASGIADAVENLAQRGMPADHYAASQFEAEVEVATPHVASDEMMSQSAPHGESAQESKKPVNPANALVNAARKAEQLKAAEANTFQQDALKDPMEQDPIDSSMVMGELQTRAHQETAELPVTEAPSLAMETSMDYPQVHHEAPSADVALEPGTGGPDLAALVRQANERRKNANGNSGDTAGTDFIAAARRAAQAAALEAGAVEQEIEEKKEKGLLASLPDLFRRRKKVLVLAAAATLFVAIAIPLAAKFMGGEETRIASADNNLVIEQSLEANANQTANQFEANASSAFSETTIAAPVQGSVDTSAFSQDNQPLNDAFGNDSQIDTQTDALNVASVETQDQDNDTLAQPVELFETDGLDFAPDALKQAVRNGEPNALFEIGRRYTDGDGTAKNLEQAAIWYERAANLGFAPAQYIIGNFNEKGFGLDKNADQARQWYEKAASGGHVIAMHNLAVLQATPNALAPEPNMNEAFKWFSKAADYGVRDSQVNAGIFHTKGFGTDVNLVEAYKWFSIAAKAGDKDAANKRDLIANAIKPEDLEIARTLAEDWKPLEVVTAANEVTVKNEWKAVKAAASAFKIDRKAIAVTQDMLNKAGFNAGTPDGIMGQKTRSAISQFQKREGLPVTGNIDINLIQKLRSSVGA